MRIHDAHRFGTSTGRTLTTAVTAALMVLPTVALVTVAPAAAAPLTYAIDSAAPPAAGTVGDAYSHAFTADASHATWTVTAGTLPASLTLDPTTGVLDGTPTTAGTSTDVTVTAAWHGYTALTAGYSHSCGLTPAGAADCWGLDNAGRATDQTGPYTALTASNSGNPTCCGTDQRGTPGPITTPPSHHPVPCGTARPALVSPELHKQ